MTSEATTQVASLTQAGPELVFGLVGALGTDLDIVTQALESALATVHYRCHQIRLSSFLKDIDGLPALQLSPEDKRLVSHMDAGDKLRELLKSGDALAVAAIAEIQEIRSIGPGKSPQTPLPRTAYILRSLKNPDEVATLRRIYGDGFFLVAAYSQRDHRLHNLARRIAHSNASPRPEEYYHLAQPLIRRDQVDSDNPYGQNVRQTFPLADVFLDVSEPEHMRQDLKRFIEMAFSHPYHTPTKDEFAMFHAEAAALRSAALSRQVGCVIATNEGDIVAVGTNEVPKAHGGQYWTGDDPDRRDFQLGYEPSDKMKKVVLADIISKLRTSQWLTDDKAALDVDALVSAALDKEHGPLRSSHLSDLIEFARPMHAEMAALIDASRRGTSVKGHRLYTTTFPCHDCARHIIASGIACIIYVHPYPKSHAQELYLDSLIVEGVADTHHLGCKSFIGLSPRRYMTFFEKVKRKDHDGATVRWNMPDGPAPVPRTFPSHPGYLIQEQAALDQLHKTMEQAGLNP